MSAFPQHTSVFTFTYLRPCGILHALKFYLNQYTFQPRLNHCLIRNVSQICDMLNIKSVKFSIISYVSYFSEYVIQNMFPFQIFHTSKICTELHKILMIVSTNILLPCCIFKRKTVFYFKITSICSYSKM